MTAQPGYSMTIGYDNWNRPASKVYAGDLTKIAGLCYDGTGCTNSEIPGRVGRLTGHGNADSWTLLSHNLLGEITGTQQYTMRPDATSFAAPPAAYEYWASGTAQSNAINVHFTDFAGAEQAGMTNTGHAVLKLNVSG